MATFPTPKLDLKDKKILHELDFNARMPYSLLARKVGLSKQGVEYKVNNLLKKGIIKGFYPIINIPKLGFVYCRFCFSFRNITPEKEQEIFTSLEKNEKVFWIFTAQGFFDALVAIWVKNISEFRLFVEDFLMQYGSYIDVMNESINTDVILYQNRFLLKNIKTREIILKETAENMSVDEIDKKILKVLCSDVRISLVALGKKTGVSAKVVAYRIKQMEKQKLILGYRPVMNYNALGYAYYKIWMRLHNINKKELTKLYEFLKNNPLVLYVVKGVGFPGELDIEVVVQSNIELYEFIKILKLSFPSMIGEQKMLMFMETKKARFLPF